MKEAKRKCGAFVVAAAVVCGLVSVTDGYSGRMMNVFC